MAAVRMDDARQRDWVRVALVTIIGLVALRRAGAVRGKWFGAGRVAGIVRAAAADARALAESLNGVQIVIATLLGRFLIANIGVVTGLTHFLLATRIVNSLTAGGILAKPLPAGIVRDVFAVAAAFPFLLFHGTAKSLIARYLRDGDGVALRYLWNQGGDNVLLNSVMRLQISPRNAHRPITLDVSKHLGAEWQHLGIVKCHLFFVGTPEQLERAQSLVLHFHGGGFVAMSPLHHEEYLTEWAKQLAVPILSVDYVKAPEHPFPAASLQTFAVYKLLLETKGACLGIHTGEQMPRIVVTGDSAGGNLSASMTLRALSEGLPAPAGVMLTYPGLSFNWSAFRSYGTDDGTLRPLSSYFRFGDDAVISARILQVVPEAYLAGNVDRVIFDDMFLAPLTAPTELLARFPPTVIAVGDCDPLVDDAVHFANRLRQSNAARKVHLHVEKGVSHGFLQFMALMPASRKMVAAIAQHISTLF